MNCLKCGIENAFGSAFCTSCGEGISRLFDELSVIEENGKYGFIDVESGKYIIDPITEVRKGGDQRHEL